jgi:lipid A 4'-phosphatase
VKKIISIEFVIPLLFLLSATVFFRVTNADLYIAGLFYSSQGWFLEDTWIVAFLHRYSSVPAIVVSAAAAGLLIYGLVSRKELRHKKSALYCLLVFLVGIVLIVNLVFKEHWGRPRPNQTQAFGAPRQYLSVWEKGDCRECKSFPCGDASAGFFFIFPYFILRNKSPRKALFFLLLGIGSGVLFGLGRMARGAHFTSDVIWAGGFMYLTCAAFYYALRMHIPAEKQSVPHLVASKGRPDTVSQA